MYIEDFIELTDELYCLSMQKKIDIKKEDILNLRKIIVSAGREYLNNYNTPSKIINFTIYHTCIPNSSLLNSLQIKTVSKQEDYPIDDKKTITLRKTDITFPTSLFRETKRNDALSLIRKKNSK